MKTISVKYKITYTDRAKGSIQSIFYHIKYHLLNPIAAKNFYFQIIKKIQILEFLPYAFSVYKNTNLRYMLYKHWLIIYEIKENYVIEIQTIISSKQNSKYY